MAFITVEDLYGSIECVAFPRIYEKIKPLLHQDAVVRVSGKIDISPDKLPVIIIDTVEEPEEQQKKKEEDAQVPVPEKKEQTIWLDARGLDEEMFTELLEIVQDYAGSVTAKILHGGKRYEFDVNVSRALIAELRTFLPEACSKIV